MTVMLDRLHRAYFLVHMWLCGPILTSREWSCVLAFFLLVVWVCVKVVWDCLV
jgi:hypothetical protein